MKLSRTDIRSLIVDAIERINMLRKPEDQIEIADDTVLYGTAGSLDSLGLVALVLDLEDQLAELTGDAVVLADEKAVSSGRSPFRTVSSLTEHVFTKAESTEVEGANV